MRTPEQKVDNAQYMREYRRSKNQPLLDQRRERRRKLSLLKMDRPCYDCGGVFSPECMDWDHRPGTSKLFQIGHAIQRKFSLVLEELAKCDLVCANCHRLRTIARKDYLKTNPQTTK